MSIFFLNLNGFTDSNHPILIKIILVILYGYDLVNILLSLTWPIVDAIFIDLFITTCGANLWRFIANKFMHSTPLSKCLHINKFSIPSSTWKYNGKEIYSGLKVVWKIRFLKFVKTGRAVKARLTNFVRSLSLDFYFGFQ